MIKILIIGFSFLLSFWGDVNAAETKKVPQIHVQISHTEPWGYFDDNNAITGIWCEIAQAIADEAGLSIYKTLAPHARLIHNLNSGEVDISFLPKAEDWSAFMTSSGFLFSHKSIVIPREAFTINNYEDLYGLKIGVVNNIRLHSRFDDDLALNKQSFRNYEILINMLTQKRLDAIAGNNISLFYLLDKLQARSLVNEQLILQKNTVWVQFSKKSTHLDKIPQVRQAVDHLRGLGVFHQIINSYMGMDWLDD